jgi:hypothetical protein
MNPVLKRFRFRRFSTVQLLVALVVLLMAAPFVEELEGGHLILSVLFSLVLLAGVFAVADRKRTLALHSFSRFQLSRPDGSTIFDRTWCTLLFFSSAHSCCWRL